MKPEVKRIIIAVLGVAFLSSLFYVQRLEVLRREREAGLAEAEVDPPASSVACVDCHRQSNPGIIEHWASSTHAERGVGCVECHLAEQTEADAFAHYGATIATVVTPLDCSRCHPAEFEEFENSRHSRAGEILDSLDNYLAEVVEGNRVPFDPHGKTPGLEVDRVEGMASARVGCKQCHGSKVALQTTQGDPVTVDDLAPDDAGKPTNAAGMDRILRDEDGRPALDPGTWPNTGIGRINLDGSRGSCSACHSRHDFSPRRARQPENCGKCHLGPDHPQKEVYEESKHGVAYRDLRELMNLDAATWVLGRDYSAAPTCATCHMSGHMRNGGKVTHDPGRRISWTNRPPISTRMDTDAQGNIVTEDEPARRRELVADSAEQKRTRMKEVCSHCHTPDYVNAFYRQYDDFLILYNEKFGRPGQQIMDALHAEGLLTDTQFDESLEWSWFYLWHHEGRRARHGASMMAPDYAHWHGMYEVAERFYEEVVPEARALVGSARAEGRTEAAARVQAVIDEILARPEHAWFGSADHGSSPDPVDEPNAD